MQFKYNPGDLSRIWVLDSDKKCYLEVWADDQAYTQGLSLWKHRVIKRYLREEMKRDIDRETLILAKEELHRAIYEEFRLVNKLGGRKKSARWLDIQVSRMLRGSQPRDADAPMLPIVSQLIDLDASSIALPQAHGSDSPTESVVGTAHAPAGGSVAQVGVPLPPMVEGVRLPVNAEAMTTGARLPEPERTQNKRMAPPGEDDARRSNEEPKVNTDPDESTTFGIKVQYGRSGPT